MRWKVEVEPTDDERVWRITKPTYIKGFLITSGFHTDGASIPRLLWWLIPQGGRKFPAAVLHDFLYKKGYTDKKSADWLFLEVMIENGVEGYKAISMYYAVKWFGKRAWDNHRSRGV